MADMGVSSAVCFGSGILPFCFCFGFIFIFIRLTGERIQETDLTMLLFRRVRDLRALVRFVPHHRNGHRSRTRISIRGFRCVLSLYNGNDWKLVF